MGGGQSVRAKHFTRPEETAAADPDDDSDKSHISISNKTVERLVEDANLAKTAAEAAAAAISNATITKPSKQDHKEKKFIEKLKSLDDIHTERAGLTIEEMRALHKRLELRTANMPELQEVCGGAAAKLIECYNAEDPPECWRTVSDFSKCVQEASVERLHKRCLRAAREQARLTQCVAQARRDHTLKDITPRLKSEAASS